MVDIRTWSHLAAKSFRKYLGFKKNNWLLWDLTQGFKYHSIWNYNDAKGWLSTNEVKCLFDLSLSLSSPVPVIVEIGSWMGQSSIVLSKGIHNKINGKVYCIDPFDSKIESITDEMRAQVHDTCNRQNTIYDIFLTNIERAGVAGSIQVLKGFSYEFASTWNLPIDLLFIDANHNFEATYKDFVDWSVFVKPRGYVVFHDVELPSKNAKFYEGPGRVIEKLLIGNQDYEKGILVDYLFYARKLK